MNSEHVGRSRHRRRPGRHGPVGRRQWQQAMVVGHHVGRVTARQRGEIGADTGQRSPIGVELLQPGHQIVRRRLDEIARLAVDDALGEATDPRRDRWHAHPHQFGQGIAEGLGPDAQQHAGVGTNVLQHRLQFIEGIAGHDMDAGAIDKHLTHFHGADQMDFGELGQPIQGIGQHAHSLVDGQHAEHHHAQLLARGGVIEANRRQGAVDTVGNGHPRGLAQAREQTQQVGPDYPARHHHRDQAVFQYVQEALAHRQPFIGGEQQEGVEVRIALQAVHQAGIVAVRADTVEVQVDGRAGRKVVVGDEGGRHAGGQHVQRVADQGRDQHGFDGVLGDDVPHHLGILGMRGRGHLERPREQP